ncbi:MAG: bifunctional folylpolyglutamate synthase/dihydrofolate synthase [Coriobacteriia bacterium]
MSEAGMTYESAVARLESALTFGIHPSLDGIQAIADRMGRPQDAFSSVQITGTNGKTSVTRLTAALLSAHGLRAGSYTSPHLQEYRERIQIDGAMVSGADFAHAITAAFSAADRAGIGATEFELLTAGALHAFRAASVDFAVLEVGMGGRWDATSVVTPAVAVITGVSLDHIAHLGETVQEIAADKAHIIKQGSAVVLGPGTEGLEAIFLARSALTGTPTRAVREGESPSPLPEENTVRFQVLEAAHEPGGKTFLQVWSSLSDYGEAGIAAPAYQAANVATAIAAAESALDGALRPDAIRRALDVVRFPARFEVFAGDPLVVVDGSHNPEAARVLAQAIRESFGETRPRVLLGVLADKDVRGIVEALKSIAAGFAVTAPDSQRALTTPDLAELVHDISGQNAICYDDVAQAVAALTAPGEGPLVITGSLTTAGQARSILLSR